MLSVFGTRELAVRAAGLSRLAALSIFNLLAAGPLHATWLKGEALTRCSDAKRGARV
jgi:hypothetical protein